MVVGDSLAAGPGAWPDAYAAAGGCAVSNVARPGAPLSEGLRQLERVPNAGGIALVELGGHDLLRNSPHDRFAQDLDTLLVALQSRGCQVVLLELPLLPFQNGYGRVQRRLAEARGAALVPRRVLATALTLPGHTTDGLHLSARGHAWLGRELARWVRCDAGAGT
jgi:acyl-CoA thioesterase-1